MKAFNQGAFFRVTASSDDVERFAGQWPCSGFRYGDRVSFMFDAKNGDLVDIIFGADYGKPLECDDVDGGALKAMADDCMTYGVRQLALNHISTLRTA